MVHPQLARLRKQRALNDYRGLRPDMKLRMIRGRAMSKSHDDSYKRGYRRGKLRARRLVSSFRSRFASGDVVAPNELGYILKRLYRRMDAAGERTIAEQPVSDYSPAYRSLRGEYFGFCAALTDFLSQPEGARIAVLPAEPVNSAVSPCGSAS